MKMNPLKRRMAAGETVYGMFLNTCSPIVTEMIGLSGFDFVLIDSEHGPTGVMENRELIMAAESRECAPLVRISSGSRDLILRTLDAGAHGVMVPQVNTAAEAEQIARYARYFPEGVRGVGTGRAADYGFAQDYFSRENERTLVAAQCEDVACLPQLDAIAAVPGIDLLFVGPYDLSSSMGAPGRVAYPDISAAVDQVLAAAKRHGKFAGIFTKDPEEVRLYRELGMRFIIYGTDMGTIAGALRNARSAIR